MLDSSDGYDFRDYMSENQTVSRGFEYGKSIDGSHRAPKQQGGTTEGRKLKRVKKVKKGATTSHHDQKIRKRKSTEDHHEGLYSDLLGHKDEKIQHVTGAKTYVDAHEGFVNINFKIQK